MRVIPSGSALDVDVPSMHVRRADSVDRCVLVCLLVVATVVAAIVCNHHWCH